MPIDLDVVLGARVQVAEVQAHLGGTGVQGLRVIDPSAVLVGGDDHWIVVAVLVAWEVVPLAEPRDVDPTAFGGVTGVEAALDLQLAGVELVDGQVPVNHPIGIVNQAHEVRAAPLHVVVVGHVAVPVDVPLQGVVVAPRGGCVNGGDVPAHLVGAVVEVLGPVPLAVLLGLQGQIEGEAAGDLEVEVALHDMVPVAIRRVVQVAVDLDPAVPRAHGQVPLDGAPVRGEVLAVPVAVGLSGPVPLEVVVVAVRQVGEVPRQVGGAAAQVGGRFAPLERHIVPYQQLEGHDARPVEVELVVVHPVGASVDAAVQVDRDLCLAVLGLQGDVPPQAA